MATKGLMDTGEFCNHFFLVFSPYAVELFGLQQSVQPIAGGNSALAISTTLVQGVENQSPLNPWFADMAQANTIIPGENRRDQIVQSRSNVYQLWDHRVSVSIKSHLPVANNLQVSEGVELLDNTICRTFLHAPLVVCQRYADGDQTFHELRRKLYNGQVQLIRKSQREFIWNKLLTSYQMRFIRLSVWVSYRRYNAALNRWFMEEKRMTIPSNGLFEVGLRFVSDV